MERTNHPARIRILATGWRLASAEVAFVLAAVSLVVFVILSLLVPGTTPWSPTSGTMWTITAGVVGFFLVLGAILLATCRWVVVDVAGRRLRLPGGEERSLSDLRAVVAIGRRGRSVTGSGRRYQYAVWSLGALTDAAGDEILRDVVEAAAAGDDDAQAGVAVTLGALSAGVIPLVDAASETRVRRVGQRLAAALDVPFAALATDDDPGSDSRPSAPPPPDVGGLGGWG